MTGRRLLPNRRESESFSFAHDGVAWRCTFSRFASGELAEIFFDGPKIGSSAGAVADEAAISASLALQFGASEADLAHALPKLADASPAGPLGRALLMYREARHASH